MKSEESRGFVHHGTAEGAMEAITSALEEAAKSGSWMACVWRVKDGQIQLLRRTTWHFPTGDFPIAIRQLGEQLTREADQLQTRPTEFEPLPRAMRPVPKDVRLVGGGDGQFLQSPEDETPQVAPPVDEEE